MAHDPPEFVTHVLELLAPLGPVAARRMFGGHGVYCGDAFIAIVAGDALYLKADDASRAEFERAGCARFTYRRRGKAAALNFYRAPDEALDAPHLMAPWGRLALAAALRARAAKKTGRSRRPASTRARAR